MSANIADTLRAVLKATGKTAVPPDRETDRDVVISAVETLRIERDDARSDAIQECIEAYPDATDTLLLLAGRQPPQSGRGYWDGYADGAAHERQAQTILADREADDDADRDQGLHILRDSGETWCGEKWDGDCAYRNIEHTVTSADPHSGVCLRCSLVALSELTRRNEGLATLAQVALDELNRRRKRRTGPREPRHGKTP